MVIICFITCIFISPKFYSDPYSYPEAESSTSNSKKQRTSLATGQKDAKISDETEEESFEDFLNSKNTTAYWLKLKTTKTIDFKATNWGGWTVMHKICDWKTSSDEELKRLEEVLEHMIILGGDLEVLNKNTFYTPLMYAMEQKNKKL